MRRALVVSALLALAALPTPVLAGESDAPSMLRDPKSQRGVSPFWEAIKKGDDAARSGDPEGAKAAYQGAIELEPKDPTAHYRLGQAHAGRGDLKEAEASYQDALRLAASKPAVRAKVLFALADLKERLRALDDATTAWTQYEGQARGSRAAGVFPAVAPERKKRIAEWTKLVTDYAAVKDRIKKRLEEADKKSAASARDPQNR